MQASSTWARQAASSSRSFRPDPMKKTYKIQIFCALFVLLVTAVGCGLLDVSSKSHYAKIVLKEGETAEFHPFYPLTANFTYIRGKFNRTSLERPELGDSQNKNDWRKDGYIHYKNPGVPILLKVTLNQQTEFLMRAMPNSGRNSKSFFRDFTLTEEKYDLYKFPWPPSGIRENLPKMRGRSSIHVEVKQVGAALRGETIELVLGPPQGFKSGQENYGWLWFFYFIPLISIPFSLVWIFAALLLNRRYQKKQRAG